MKKLAFLLLVVCSSSYAECTLGNKTKEDILKAQICVEGELETLKKIFSDYEEHYEHIDKELKEIIEAQERCTKSELIFEVAKVSELTDGKKKALETSVNECRLGQHDRLTKWTNITKRFRDTTVRIDDLKASQYQKGLELLNALIKDKLDSQKNKPGDSK